MVGADSGNLGLAKVPHQAPGQLLDHRVPRVPAKRLVDRPESLDVGENHRHFVFHRTRDLNKLIEALEEQGPVRQPRKLVVHRQIVEPLLL